jgi:5-methyltetrahydrofolate corrinoid/iron sulfur protein methyltransferase
VNVDRLKTARKVEQFAETPQLVAGAAVSPFKYTEYSRLQQYLRVRKKVAQGAAFIICQAGWDAEKSRQLIEALAPLGVPVLGNVLFLDLAAAGITKDLPGCVITDEFMEKLRAETPADAVQRAAQQLAMFRGLGYRGADLSGFESTEQIQKLLDAALAIDDWEKFKENMTFSPGSHAHPRGLSARPAWLDFLHRNAFEPDGALCPMVRTLLSPAEHSFERLGFVYKVFAAWEALAKGELFDCRLCGDCYLPEDYFICTQGACEKRMPNPPCGDATPEGKCGNNEKRVCVGELLYHRAIKTDDLAGLEARVNPPRDFRVNGTASILNHYFGRSHESRLTLLEQTGIIQIGETIHATIPRVGVAMRYIVSLGEEGFTRPNRGLLVLKDLFTSQARMKPAYIDINVDALGENTPHIMRQLIRMLKQYGEGTPPCVDSSNPEVLRAGLDEWYATPGAKPPLVNSVNYADVEKTEPIMALRREKRFSIVCLLSGPKGVLESADAMVNAAHELFDMARRYGFKPTEIFFDAVVLGLMFDSCVDELGNPKPSHTYNSFHAIERIMRDPTLKGVNTSLGISNWTHQVKRRRIGHNRAYLHAAMQRGLNTAIVDVTREYVIKPAAKELVQLVQTFAELDASEDALLRYSQAVRSIRQKSWV